MEGTAPPPLLAGSTRKLKDDGKSVRPAPARNALSKRVARFQGAFSALCDPSPPSSRLGASGSALERVEGPVSFQGSGCSRNGWKQSCERRLTSARATRMIRAVRSRKCEVEGSDEHELSCAACDRAWLGFLCS